MFYKYINKGNNNKNITVVIYVADCYITKEVLQHFA